MRIYDKENQEELDQLNPFPWQVELLKLNPDYVWWGCHEDYMSGKKGWNGALFYDSWDEFWGYLNDMNEVVNFYFHIDREHIECNECQGSGLTAQAKIISDSWYNFGNGWQHSLTQDEVQALFDHNRLFGYTECPKAEDFNKTKYSHDAINHWICRDIRLERMGIEKLCKKCDGRGIIYTADHAHALLTLWVLHPRKGCSRGVEIKIQENDLPDIFRFLNEAAERNEQRFSKVKGKMEIT